MVHAQDRAGVQAALTVAEALDATGDPWHLRDLWATFSDMHPETDRLTADWLAAAPDDPRAEVARGWFLWRQGWIWRGEDHIDRSLPERLQKGHDLFRQSLALMQEAYFQRQAKLPPYRRAILPPRWGWRSGPEPTELIMEWRRIRP